MGINSIALVGIAHRVGGRGLAYQGITYTSRETVIDSAPSMPPPTPKRPSRFPLYWAGWRLQAGSSWSWLEPRNRLRATESPPLHTGPCPPCGALRALRTRMIEKRCVRKESQVGFDEGEQDVALRTILNGAKSETIRYAKDRPSE